MPGGFGVFLKEVYQNFYTTGAIAPSSRWVAREFTRHMRGADGPGQRIVEVGPGTGAITAGIVRRLGPRDRLTLVELNDRFVDHLRRRFETDPHFRRVADQVELIHDRVEALPADASYDLVISGLPLNNFPVEVVQHLVTHLEGMLKPGGTMSFFEYAMLRQVKRAVTLGAERRRLAGVESIVQQFVRRHEHDRRWVLRNLPPAWVHHVRRSDAPPARVAAS